MPQTNKKHINQLQKEKLVAFMLAHKDLAMGKMNGINFQSASDDLYNQLAKMLNNVPGGARKDSGSWRKCWTDFRRSTIRRETERRQRLKEGSLAMTLTEPETRVIKNLVPKGTFETEEVLENGFEIKEEIIHEDADIQDDMFEEVDENMLNNSDETPRKRRRTSFNAFYKKSKSNSIEEENQFDQEDKNVGEEEEDYFFERVEEESERIEGEGDQEEEEITERTSGHFEVIDKLSLDLLREKVNLKKKEMQLKRRQMELEEKRHREIIKYLKIIADGIKK